MSLIKKLVFIVIVSVTLLFFPTNHTLAIDSPLLENKIEIPRRNVHSILSSLISELADRRTDLFIFQNSEPERGAVLALLGTVIKSNAIDYMMTQAPREVLFEMVKAGARIAYLAYAPNISTIAEFALDRAREDVVDWLVRNELRVGSGNLTLSYSAYNGERSNANFPFILVYNPKDKRIEIVIYSSKQIKPPMVQGSFTGSNVETGSFWNVNKWIQQGKTTLSPFTVKVSGRVDQDRSGKYKWRENPTIDIDLRSPVPNLEFRELSFLERQLLPLNKTIIAARNAVEIITNTASSVRDRISGTAQSVWEKIREGVSSIANFGSASVSSLFLSPGRDNTTVVSLRDEAGPPREGIQRDATNNREMEELRETIKRLERELETARQATRKPREVVNPRIETREVASRVEINSASIEELIRIVHIGTARAKEIIRLRPFSSLDDLERVPGIGARTIDAIKKQGLAYVRFIEEKREVEKEKAKKDSPTTNPCLSGRVDINSAPLTDLVFLQEIGESIGQRIIDHRRSSPFRSLDDLKLVRGIGSRTLERIREQGCAYIRNESSAIPLRSNSPRAEVSRSSIKEPIIALDSNNFSFLWDIGEDLPAGQPLIIENEGEGSLTWNAKFEKWISLNKDSGVLPPKESEALTLRVNPTGLKVGTHSAKLSIESNDKKSTTTEITVSITVLPAPRMAQGVVITEVKINEKEFVEIHNPTEEEIRIDQWRLSYYSNRRELINPSRSWGFPVGSILRPNSYFLVGVYGYPKEGGNPNSDLEVLTLAGLPYKSGELANSNGSLAIFNCSPRERANECLVDAVGWGNTIVKKGETSIAPGEDRSIARRKNSKGRYIDNENNSTDFSIGITTPINSKGETSDLISPDPITDLAVNCKDGGAILKWTAPRDPDTWQELLKYEVHHKKAFEQWEDGTIIQNPPAVSTAGTKESFVIKALNYGADYQFKIVTTDPKNRSPISNIVSCLTETVQYDLFWPTFQGNFQRDGKMINPRSTMGSEDPIVRRLISGERDSDHINDPILIDSQGSIYFTGEITTNNVAKRGFFAFDRDGILKWHFGNNEIRFSHSALLPDGSIFAIFQEMKTLYNRSTVIKIDRGGTVDWSVNIDGFYPTSHPAVSTHGKIYLLFSSSDGRSGKLVAVDSSNGAIVWEHLINRNVVGDISLAIDRNESIYFSLADILYSINQKGEMRWKKQFPFIAPDGHLEYNRAWLSNPVISGNILYLLVHGESEASRGKCDHLYALDLNKQGDKLWKTSCGWWLRGLPAANYNGEVFFFNFSDPTFRNTGIFGYNHRGQPLSGWPLSIPGGGMLKSMVIDANNNLYGLFIEQTLRSFDSQGKIRWQTSNFKLRRNNHLSMDQDGNLYLGGNRYLYKIGNWLPDPNKTHNPAPDLEE